MGVWWMIYCWVCVHGGWSVVSCVCLWCRCFVSERRLMLWSWSVDYWSTRHHCVCLQSTHVHINTLTSFATCQHDCQLDANFLHSLTSLQQVTQHFHTIQSCACPSALCNLLPFLSASSICCPFCMFLIFDLSENIAT